MNIIRGCRCVVSRGQQTAGATPYTHEASAFCVSASGSLLIHSSELELILIALDTLFLPHLTASPLPLSGRAGARLQPGYSQAATK